MRDTMQARAWSHSTPRIRVGPPGERAPPAIPPHPSELEETIELPGGVVAVARPMRWATLERRMILCFSPTVDPEEDNQDERRHAP